MPVFKMVELPNSNGTKNKWIFNAETIVQVFKEASSNQIEVEYYDGSTATFSFETPELADAAFEEIKKALLS